MLLSCKVINNNRVSTQSTEQIIAIDDIKTSSKVKKEVVSDATYEQYENIASAIIKNAKMEADAIRNNAIQESRNIEENAYNEAYKKGLDEGRKKGYEDAYNDTVVKGKMEIENLKSLAEQNASNIVKSAKYQCSKYFESKEEEIKKLAIEIAAHILKERITENDAINNMVYDAIEISKNSKTIIIKCNSKYEKSISEISDKWKKEIPYNGEIFVVEDNYLQDGFAIIEKDNGKVKVSVDDAFVKIKEVLLKTE
ncbi:FliH/SctL family protein [Clostridium hydrogenum]|uniref:FliH/SctL family protein n=1 Tax=Clostridium hydrogenum TaxID=2855764 RepID=UPI001F389B83|nr:flagellar assembly protein FliH [Clostridium hydrogenum]